MLWFAAYTSLSHLGRPEVWPYLAIMGGGLLGYHYVALPLLERRRLQGSEVPMPRTAVGFLAGVLFYALTFSGVYYHFRQGATPERDGVRFTMKIERELDVFQATGSDRRYALTERRVEGSLAMRGQGAFSKLDQADTFVDEDALSGEGEHWWIQLQGAPGTSTLFVSDSCQVVEGRKVVEHYLGEVEYDLGSWEELAAGRPVEFHLSSKAEAARREAEERSFARAFEAGLPPEMAGLQRSATAVVPVKGRFRVEGGVVRFTSTAPGNATVLFER